MTCSVLYNVCIAYTGDFAICDECPYCLEPRTFGGRSNIPLIRLINMYRDPKTAHALGYRARYHSAPGNFADIFDGAHYKQLLDRQVVVGRDRLDHQYFSFDTDIALGISTDGFGPFKSRKQSCWLLLVFNYNLHPSIRHRLENMLCSPFIDELQELGQGSLLMTGSGHNGKYPCRACNIVGIRTTRSKDPSKLSSTHYTPLARPFAGDNEGPAAYDPLDLPLRTHVEIITDAATRTGINGISSLAAVSSLDFPTSFPHDFMHVMFQNVIPTLIDLWTHTKKKKTFGSGRETYIIDEKDWEEIGRACYHR
ncbi:Transposase family Tnp2 protein [Ceratobasidium sp. AG-Ba]|nr:Transposase family Tnp2 protein [Ceratobasidium sp. AG-Ba]